MTFGEEKQSLTGIQIESQLELRRTEGVDQTNPR